uniref:Uncharacterized protein n=1 Tax=Anguilla anguilla TaxID=7936 RepID=A0A0E9UY43_ANGAN
MHHILSAAGQSFQCV